jgi:hypothetical protein
MKLINVERLHRALMKKWRKVQNERAQAIRATANASAVCEWVAVHIPDRVREFQSKCGSFYARVAPSPYEQGAHHCYKCGRPIKFVEAAR